ncbi:hypothetical protein HZA33_04490, partial [Candidatus Pacearchaeota archaeon]|nr:hypothetical protein [Candidatus Pacearchaeota archaeon]
MSIKKSLRMLGAVIGLTALASTPAFASDTSKDASEPNTEAIGQVLSEYGNAKEDKAYARAYLSDDFDTKVKSNATLENKSDAKTPAQNQGTLKTEDQDWKVS